MKNKELKERIKSLLKGMITSLNEINQGMLNQEGINYICEKSTNQICGLFDKQKEEMMKKIEKMGRTVYKDEKKQYVNYEATEYNQALEDIIGKIREL